MNTPVVVDLYCCAGGATKGYQRAGFDTVGIDIKPRPNYCGDSFRQADVIECLENFESLGWKPKLFHASPPCQAGCTLTTGTNYSQASKYDQLVPETRRLLDLTGVPYVIEQPSNHAGLIRTDLMLCTDMFEVGPPPWIQRHRDFEISGFAVTQPVHPAGPVRGHKGYVRGYRGATMWKPGFFREGPYVAAYGNGRGKATVSEMQHAMGIDWTDVREELTEAIPPVYTEYIGTAFRNGVSNE